MNPTLTIMASLNITEDRTKIACLTKLSHCITKDESHA